MRPRLCLQLNWVWDPCKRAMAFYQTELRDDTTLCLPGGVWLRRAFRRLFLTCRSLPLVVARRWLSCLVSSVSWTPDAERKHGFLLIMNIYIQEVGLHEVLNSLGTAGLCISEKRWCKTRPISKNGLSRLLWKRWWLLHTTRSAVVRLFLLLQAQWRGVVCEGMSYTRAHVIRNPLLCPDYLSPHPFIHTIRVDSFGYFIFFVNKGIIFALDFISPTIFCYSLRSGHTNPWLKPEAHLQIGKKFSFSAFPRQVLFSLAWPIGDVASFSIILYALNPWLLFIKLAGLLIGS